MTTKLSSKGQIVLPSLVRKKLALEPGDSLDIQLKLSESDPQIIITPRKPKRPKMRIITDPSTGWPVLKGPPGTPKLTSEMVKQMLADFP